MKLVISFITIIGIIFCDIAIAFEPIYTELVVRAKARDGKFIGSSIGGALVRIKSQCSNDVWMYPDKRWALGWQ